jgi:tartrate dehydratase alpha subunit/fumarate hydratase class I-like protein
MALQQNLYIDQGADFTTVLTLTNAAGTGPLNLTGSTFACQMRKNHTSSTAVTISVSIQDALEGEIVLNLDDSITTGIKAGRYVYDIEMLMAGVKSRIVEGLIIVSPQVTQV